MSGPRILFLDQTGALGGGELALRDIVRPYRTDSRVVLFADGPFRALLEGDGVEVVVATSRSGRSLGPVRRESGPLPAALALPHVVDLAGRVATLAGDHDLIYANSQKAAVVGALAAVRSGRPLIVHLHDILTADHFSRVNRWLAVTASNRGAAAVIADSAATGRAFVAAGGRPDLVEVVHYGFAPVPGFERPEARSAARARVVDELDLTPDGYLVGHIGRLSPWKGQDVFIRALARVPDAVGLIVGSALFGEDEIEPGLRRLAEEVGVPDRLVLTGFRADPARIMAACDLVVHSSTAPEPFGRVIVESMLVGTPVVAARAGGPCEIIDEGRTGWLTEPGDDRALAARIEACAADPVTSARVASAARSMAEDRFDLATMQRSIARVIDRVLAGRGEGDRASPGRRRWPSR